MAYGFLQDPKSGDGQFDKEIPSTHDLQGGEDLEDSPDYDPLSRDDVAALLRLAKENKDNFKEICRIQLRLKRGIPGMTYIRPAYGPVAEKSSDLDSIFVAEFEKGDDTDLVDRIYAILQRSSYKDFPIFSTFSEQINKTVLATNPALLRKQLTEVGHALSQILNESEKIAVEGVLGYGLSHLTPLADLLEGKYSKENVVDSDGIVQPFTQLQAVLLKLGSLCHVAYVAESGVNNKDEFRSSLDALRQITSADWSLSYPTMPQWQTRKAEIVRD